MRRAAVPVAVLTVLIGAAGLALALQASFSSSCVPKGVHEVEVPQHTAVTTEADEQIEQQMFQVVGEALRDGRPLTEEEEAELKRLVRQLTPDGMVILGGEC